MVSEKTLRRYIEKLDLVIQTEDISGAEYLIDEIIAVFDGKIKNIKSKLSIYQPSFIASMNGRTVENSSPADYLKDAVILRSRLQSELESIESDHENGKDVSANDNTLFISHRSLDADVAEMLKDFLICTGVPNGKIFCSSLPGNDVRERISPEVKLNIKKSVANILILSNDYYKSAYCLNEAGVAWYRDDALVIPIGLPEINDKNMLGFIDSDYKLRRLDSENDIAYIYDQIKTLIGGEDVSQSVIIGEINKLKNKYSEYLKNRTVLADDEDDDDVDVEKIESIYDDGYHEVTDFSGKVISKGTFIKGNLVDGIHYNVILKVFEGDEDDPKEVTYLKLKENNFYYVEYEQYKGHFFFLNSYQEILDEGLQYFYIVNKKVTLVGKRVKPTFECFRSLELFLKEEEPETYEYIMTGETEYSETDYADIEV